MTSRQENSEEARGGSKGKDSKDDKRDIRGRVKDSEGIKPEEKEDGKEVKPYSEWLDVCHDEVRRAHAKGEGRAAV